MGITCRRYGSFAMICSTSIILIGNGRQEGDNKRKYYEKNKQSILKKKQEQKKAPIPVPKFRVEQKEVIFIF